MESAKQLVAHMNDLVRDGEVKNPMVHRLAKVAGTPSEGISKLMTDCGFANLISEVPGGSLAKHFVRPSALLHFLYSHCPEKLKETMGCSDQDLLEGFWKELLPMSPELQNLACFRGTRSSDWRCIVPCTIHEDAGPYTKKLSTNIVSFGGLWWALVGSGGLWWVLV